MNINGIHHPRVDSMWILCNLIIVQVDLVAVCCAHNDHMKCSTRHKIGVNFTALFTIPSSIEPGISDDDMLAADRIEPRVQVKCNRWMRPNTLALLEIQVERMRQHLDAADDVQPRSGHQMGAEFTIEGHFLKRWGQRWRIFFTYFLEMKLVWASLVTSWATHKFNFIFEDVWIEWLDPSDVMY